MPLIERVFAHYSSLRDLPVFECVFIRMRIHHRLLIVFSFNQVTKHIGYDLQSNLLSLHLSKIQKTSECENRFKLKDILPGEFYKLFLSQKYEPKSKKGCFYMIWQQPV